MSPTQLVPWRQRIGRPVIQKQSKFTSARPSLVSGPDSLDLAAIAARFFQPMQDVPEHWSLTAFLHPTSGSFLLPPGTHSCTPVSSISLKQAMPPSEPCSWSETTGEPKALVPTACRRDTFRTSRAWAYLNHHSTRDVTLGR